MPPAVIEGLAKSEKKAEVKLSPQLAKSMEIPEIDVSEKSFRWLVNENDIGNDKLCEGIRLFTQGIINKLYF
jgi:transaldolase